MTDPSLSSTTLSSRMMERSLTSISLKWTRLTKYRQSSGATPQLLPTRQRTMILRSVISFQTAPPEWNRAGFLNRIKRVLSTSVESVTSDSPGWSERASVLWIGTPRWKVLNFYVLRKKASREKPLWITSLLRVLSPFCINLPRRRAKRTYHLIKVES